MVQGYDGGIAVVWWLAGLVLLSFPFLWSSSLVSASLLAGLQCRLEESLCVHSPGTSLDSCFTAFQPYTEIRGNADAWIPQNFLATPAHGLGVPS